MSAILTSLSPELLVHILGFLSSPGVLYSAIAASSRLYRTFTAYRHSVTSAVLQEAIPPEIECDFLLAFRAQAVWKYVPEGNDKAEIDSSQDHLDSLDQESTAVLDESRAGRTKEIYNLAPDSGRSPRLWNFYRKFEHFIQLYTARALSTLQQSSLDSDESKLQLSLSEETRLKRAFFRCEVYTCLFQISQTTHEDTRDEAPHIDPGPAYIETYPPWEIEEIACIVHFYTNLIQELCERIEDDFITSVREKATECASPVHGNEENRLSTWLDYHSIEWYSESSKRHLRQTHIDYLVSRGMLAVWKLTHAPGPSQTVRKMVVATHFTSNDVPSIMFQLQRATSIVKSDQTDSRTRSHGWAWASEAMTPYHRLRAAAHSEYNLRNQGYVFWDRERLLKYKQLQTPRSPVKDWYEFPLGHQRYTDTPGVETKLNGVRVHEEVIRDISDDINGRVCKYDENGNGIFYTEGRKEGGEEEYVISWREQIYSSTLQY